MRLIDADELIKTIKAHHYPLKSHLNSTDYGMFTIGIQYAIDEQTTVDAVPVVRCKDCCHCSIEGSLYLCALWNHLTELYDFCSDAKRWEKTA